MCCNRFIDYSKPGTFGKKLVLKFAENFSVCSKLKHDISLYKFSNAKKTPMKKG